MAMPPPKMGPEPVLLSRKEVDMLYVTLEAVTNALEKLGVDYIVTGGSLLGAVRQHSILFCDDDIDIAIIEQENGTTEAYDRVKNNLQHELGKDFTYLVRPWEGGDKIRPKAMTSVFIDLFTIRKFETKKDLIELVGVKKNGKPQSDEYVQTILDKINTSAYSQGEKLPLFPIWHFNTRKAVEMWPKEVYRQDEMFPLSQGLKFGPLTKIKGPKTPVLLLKRAFGLDCFEVYFQSGSHKNMTNHQIQNSNSQQKGHNSATGKQEVEAVVKDGSFKKIEGSTTDSVTVSTPTTTSIIPDSKSQELAPLILAGGTWEGGRKTYLQEEHYIPMQPLLKAKRRPTLHGKESLFQYLETQSKLEHEWLSQAVQVFTSKGETGKSAENDKNEKSLFNTLEFKREGCTVYMDGVFDLFHIGHLEAIRKCAALGDRVIIGVTGDIDAAGYKRPPIISQPHRVAVVAALKEVDSVVCPCPLIVTKEFMDNMKIDLVVHGFATDADAMKQEEFFSYPMRNGKFKRISYFDGLSTTDIIEKIQSLPKPPSEEDGVSLPAASNAVTQEVTTTTTATTTTAASAATTTTTTTVAAENGESGNSLSKAQALALRKPQWFGAAISAVPSSSQALLEEPFPLSMRIVIEPFLRKATLRREEALGAIRQATGDKLYDEVMSLFLNGDCGGGGGGGGVSTDDQNIKEVVGFDDQVNIILRQETTLQRRHFPLATEGMFSFDTKRHDLLGSFLASGNLPTDTDLSQLHLDATAKESLFYHLTRQINQSISSLSPSIANGTFQQVFDNFVTEMCAPYLASLFECDEIYYQAFPCIRVVQPDDFSIGPHADVSYGHHPCSINFYLPLTDIFGTNSLFLESRPKSEDWHPIIGSYGKVKHFAGATCAHWTVENKTKVTRVSLDFRLIPGPLFRALKCGGAFPNGQLDVYRQKGGYYSCCKRVVPSSSSSSSSATATTTKSAEMDQKARGVWERQGPLLTPDERIGYPWTLKNMERYRKMTTEDSKEK